MVNEKQKYYLIYIITNKINGKIYVGCHQTYDLNDKYMGSGTLIRLAQNKYGLENFNKNILIYCDSVEEMFFLEREIISQLNPEYNIHEGGLGGWNSVNARQPNNEFRRLGGLSVKNRNRYIPWLNTPEIIAKRTATLKARYVSGEITGSFLGKRHTKEAKNRMSESSKGLTPWNKDTAVYNLPKPCIYCSAQTVVGVCRSCSQKRASKKRKTGTSKFNWPNENILFESISKIGYRATSRNLGVSDTGLRSHLGIGKKNISG